MGLEEAQLYSVDRRRMHRHVGARQIHVVVAVVVVIVVVVASAHFGATLKPLEHPWGHLGCTFAPVGVRAAAKWFICGPPAQFFLASVR